MKYILILLSLLLALQGEVYVAPDGSYQGSEDIQMAPDGSYVSGDPQMAPDGSYVGSDSEVDQYLDIYAEELDY